MRMLSILLLVGLVQVPSTLASTSPEPLNYDPLQRLVNYLLTTDPLKRVINEGGWLELRSVVFDYENCVAGFMDNEGGTL